MPTPMDAVHVRLSRRDLEELADGEVLVMLPSSKTNRDMSVVIDAAPEL